MQHAISACINAGGAIALIVVLSVLGGCALLGGGGALLLLHLQNSRQGCQTWTVGGSPGGGGAGGSSGPAGGAHYLPVFTGASYTPHELKGEHGGVGGGGGGITLFPQVCSDQCRVSTSIVCSLNG
jgi:hypothetical protein